MHVTLNYKIDDTVTTEIVSRRLNDPRSLQLRATYVTTVFQSYRRNTDLGGPLCLSFCHALEPTIYCNRYGYSGVSAPRSDVCVGGAPCMWWDRRVVGKRWVVQGRSKSICKPQLVRWIRRRQMVLHVPGHSRQSGCFSLQSFFTVRDGIRVQLSCHRHKP